MTKDPEELKKFLSSATNDVQTIVNEYNQWLSGFLSQWNDSDQKSIPDGEKNN